MKNKERKKEEIQVDRRKVTKLERKQKEII